jgi:hypothetical protein
MRIQKFNLFENVNQAKSLLKKHNIKEDEPNYVNLKDLTSKHPGYLGFFVKMWLEQNIGFKSLKDLYNLILKSTWIKNLNKPITNYTNWEELQDDIIKAKNDWKIKQMISEFPSQQKDLVVDEIKPLLIRLYSRKDKNNFLKKISRYKSSQELYRSLDEFIKGKNLNFDENIKRLTNYKIPIIHSDKGNDIIIAKVNSSSELTSIAGDTSWCIRNSETFKSYNNGVNRQFVVLLTDLNNNYRKIGITYGFKFSTAHLVDDSYISFKDLQSLLLERGFDINKLKVNIDEVNLNDISVRDCIEFGLTKEEIVKIKKSFTKHDLTKFTEEEIEKYNLKDKLEIYYKSDLEDKSLSWIIEHLDSIKLKNDRYSKNLMNKEDLIEIDPLPREIKNVDVKDKRLEGSFEWEVIEFIRNLQRYNFEDFPKWNSDKFKERIYVLKYYGAGPQNFDWDKLCKYFSGEYPSRLDDILEFGRLNGYKIGTEDLINLINSLKKRFQKNPISDWIELSTEYKELKEHVDKIINLVENKDSISEEDGKFLRENGISHINFLDIPSSLLKNYPKLKSLSEKAEIVRLYNKVLPQYTTVNYGQNNIKIYIKEVDKNKSDIDPETIVGYFYPKLKDEDFPLTHYSNVNSTLYMIVSLVKTDNIPMLSKLKLHITQNGIKFLIRILFDIETYNGKSYLREDFKLTDGEREKIFNWILMNKQIIKPNYTNQIVPNRELFEHESVSLIYYYYDWGFDKYFELIKKSKNQADKWIVVDGVNSHQIGRNRVDYFSEIFNYLKENKMEEELKDLKGKIKQNMILKKNELETLNSDRNYYSLGI